LDVTPTSGGTLDKLKLVKEKVKKGRVDRINDAKNLIIRDLFQKETTQELFMNKPVTLKVDMGEGNITSISGVITGTFGKSGKQKVLLSEEMSMAVMEKALSNGEIELKLKVYSKEISKLRNKQAH
jgi:hypothetical protein